MKIGILYAGKTGTTEKCAIELKSKLNNASTIDLTKVKPNIDDYEVIIIGSSIRMGQIHKKVKEIINDNKEKLTEKLTAYFICNGIPEETSKVFELNFNKELLDKAICYKSFGGEIELSKQKGLDKFIVKMMSKMPDKKPPKIDNQVIEGFIKKIESVLQSR